MKTPIKNRRGQKIVVLVEAAKPQKDLAFVMHGLGGFKEQPHIQILAEVLREHSYTVVRFDATNSFGESGGDYADATTTSNNEDLEDVINWAASQSWYQEPFLLTGHSLGGFCEILYAEAHPEKVLALAPMAPVVSGPLSLEYQRKKYPQEVKEWEETGWRIQAHNSKAGAVKKLKWSHMIDRLKYDALPNANKLTMPTLIIVGGNDERCPVAHQKLLINKLPGKNALHIIEGMPHTPREESHLDEYRAVFSRWVSALL